MEDLYKILGVSRNATAEDIKKAYHDLAMRYHPDHNSENPEAEYIFKKIKNAYEILYDATQREEYDEQMNQSNMEDRSSKWHKKTDSQETEHQQTQSEGRTNLSIHSLFSKYFQYDISKVFNKNYDFEKEFKEFEEAIDLINTMPEYIEQKKNEAPEPRRPQFDKAMKKIEPARNKISLYYEKAINYYKETHKYGYITDREAIKLADKICACLIKASSILMELGIAIDSANNLTPKEQREANKNYFEKKEEEFIRKEFGPVAAEKYKNRNKSLPYIFITLLFGCIAIYMIMLRKYVGYNLTMTCISSAIAGFVICFSLSGLFDGLEDDIKKYITIFFCIIVSIIFLGAGWLLYLLAPLTRILAMLVLIVCPVVYLIILFFLLF